MGQLDELELGKSIGRIEGKLDSALRRFDDLEEGFNKKIDKHDKHLSQIQTHLDERRGANHVLLAVYSFCMIGFWKLIEHIPSLLK